MMRKSFEKEMQEIEASEYPGDEALKKIFREIWDMRVAMDSISRTMEAQNV